MSGVRVVPSVEMLVDRAVNYALAAKPNTMIEHVIWADLLETPYNPGNDVYYDRIDAVRSRLETTHGRSLRSVVGEGYTVVPPEDLITVAMRSIRIANGYAKRGFVLTTQILLDEITDPAKKEYSIRQSQQIASINGMLQLGRSRMKAISASASSL